MSSNKSHEMKFSLAVALMSLRLELNNNVQFNCVQFKFKFEIEFLSIR